MTETIPSKTLANTGARARTHIKTTYSNDNMKTIQQKTEQAIKMLQSYSKKGKLTLAYSGGKDSDICRYLLEFSGVDYDMVYNNTTIDPPYTITRNKRIGAKIIEPKYTFYQLIEKKGLPSRHRRFCCAYLKEKYIGKYVVMGIRKAESVKRNNKYNSVEKCRIYSKTKKTVQILPILNWTDLDCEQFIIENNIELHPIYYDKNGKLDIKKRLGCIGCPLKSDNGKSKYIKYPKALRQLARSYKKYIDTHKCMVGLFEDIVWHIFYSNNAQEKFEQNFHGLFEPPDAKKLLEDYFHVNLDF